MIETRIMCLTTTSVCFPIVGWKKKGEKEGSTSGQADKNDRTGLSDKEGEKR